MQWHSEWLLDSFMIQDALDSFIIHETFDRNILFAFKTSKNNYFRGAETLNVPPPALKHTKHTVISRFLIEGAGLNPLLFCPHYNYVVITCIDKYSDQV